MIEAGIGALVGVGITVAFYAYFKAKAAVVVAKVETVVTDIKKI
jgi:hypothetical protein